MAGQFGNQRVTMLNLEVVQADPERNLLLVKGAVPGATGGLVMIRTAVKAPARAREGGLSMAKVDILDATGTKSGTRDLSVGAVRVQGQRAADAPGGGGGARGPARRHPQHEDAGRRPRRRQEAVAPEGHRPRAPGLDPLAPVGRRRRGARPAPALARAARQQEDAQGRAALGAHRHPAERQARRGVGRRLRRARRRSTPWSCSTRSGLTGKVLDGAARSPPRTARSRSRSATCRSVRVAYAGGLGHLRRCCGRTACCSRPRPSTPSKAPTPTEEPKEEVADEVAP